MAKLKVRNRLWHRALGVLAFAWYLGVGVLGALILFIGLAFVGLTLMYQSQEAVWYGVGAVALAFVAPIVWLALTCGIGIVVFDLVLFLAHGSSDIEWVFDR